MKKLICIAIILALAGCFVNVKTEFTRSVANFCNVIPQL